MKKLVLLTMCMVLAFSLMLVASDKKDASGKSMTGWVSDEMCGAKGNTAGHANCAKKCAEAGQKMVFVDDKEQKVMNIANQDAVKEHAGQHVQLTASPAADGAIQVSNVKTMAKKEAGKSEAEMHKDMHK